MKKKQLFAVLLAGSMTVGMAPAAAFAAEDTASEAEAQSGAESEGTAENTGDSNNADGAEAQNQDGEQAAAEAQKQAEEQAAAEAQKQAEEQAAVEAQKQAEEQAAAEAQKQAEEQAAAEEQKLVEEQAAAQTQAVTNEDSQQSPIVRNEAELKTAIENAASVDTTTTSVTEAEPSKIIISGTIELTGTVTIPENKSIAIFGENDQAVIERADSFRGNLFEVRSGSAFYMAKKDAANSEGTEGTLKVDGSVTDGSAVDGSLVYVAKGANFSLTTGITLCNNNTNAKGAAILNEGGNVLLTGGTITGNKSDNGAIYSTGVLSLEKGNGAADTEPSITGNFRADNTTPANIILSGEGRIEVKGELTAATVGFSVEEPRADYAAIVSADGLDANVYAKALQVLAPQYEGDTTQFTVDETTGKLISSEKPAPNVTKADFTKWNSITEALVTVQSDKAGQYYYKLVKHGATAPKIDTSKAGTDIAANKATNIKLSKLDANTSYDVYVCVKDSDGLVSELKKIELDQSKRPKQEETKKTAPKITKASFSKWNSATEAVVTIQSDKDGKYYYQVVEHGTKVSSISTDGDGNDITADNPIDITISDLAADKNYDVYVCVKDSDGVSSLKVIELDQSGRPKKNSTIKLKWTGFQWTSHESASVTLRANVTGTCYYAWAERNDDGTSEQPKIDTNSSTQSVSISADKNFTIYLNDLNADNGIDLYIRIKDSEGNVSGLKKLKFKQDTRPAKSDPEHTPNVPEVTKSILKGLDGELEFYPNTFYDFTVIGAGTTNSNPGEGDVKWEPLYWSTSSNPSDAQKHSSWKIGSTKGITKAATYNLYVFFRKWIYTGGQWVETDTVESAVYQFRSADITVTPSGAADGSNSGGQTGADPEATTEASATSANGDGTTSRSAVSTADNSPIGTMSALAVASLLAGGYVIVRRRKKDI